MELLEQYIESGNGPAIEDLLNSNPRLATVRTSHGISPLLLTCYYQKPQLAKIIAKHLESMDIYEAAALGLTDQVRSLVERYEFPVDTVSDHGFTALGIATHFGKEDVVRYLLSKHADPNLASQNGYQVYPLHTAISAGFSGISKMLVEAGASVNVVQNARISPLHLAAQNGDIDMIILLLENGANVAARTENDQTPADLAREKGHLEIAQILSV